MIGRGNFLIIINKIINGIQFDIEFKHKINYLETVNSSKGKSLLLKTIRSYCYDTELLRCELINYENYKSCIGVIEHLIELNDLLLLDNVELYITNDIMYKLNQSDIIVIYASCNHQMIRMENSGYYDIVYTSTKVVVRENLNG